MFSLQFHGGGHEVLLAVDSVDQGKMKTGDHKVVHICFVFYGYGLL